MSTETHREPEGLGESGSALWHGVMESMTLDPGQLVILKEACRMADRLDALDRVITERSDIFRIRADDNDIEGLRFVLVVDASLQEARQQANVMKQLVTALRIPDEVTGKIPQYRGPRGAQKPNGAAAKVKAIERMRGAA